jgi:RecJ-like exonuclease
MGCLALAVKQSEQQGDRKNGDAGRTMKDPRKCPKCDGEGRHKTDPGFKCDLCAGTGSSLIGKDGKKKEMDDVRLERFNKRVDAYKKWSAQQNKGQGRYDTTSESD